METIAHNDSVAIIDPMNDDRWDKFVENHPFGWICHLSGWKKVLEKSFYHMKGYFLVLSDNGQNSIKAALPLFQVRSWLTGNRLVSIPFATLCDPLISTVEEMSKLCEGAFHLSKKLDTPYIEIRALASSSFIQDDRLGESRFYKHHYIALENDPDQLKKKFHRSCVRQRISRAVNSNIEIIEGKTESDLQQLYQLYLMGRKRLALPPQPYIFLKSIWETFHPSKRAVILLAKRSGQYIAGLMLFKFKDRVSAEYAVVDSRFLNVSPLHLLFWEAIQSAYSEGYRIFDFGRTSPNNQSLMDFKGRWGTVVVDLHQFFYPKELSGKIATNERSLSRRFVAGLCRLSPNPVYTLLGNFVYKHMG